MIGIINVYKPAGMTSQQVVGWLRRVLKIKKAGHTGTLDPQVTGVLPVCLGRATKVAQWLSDQDKSYCGELTLGQNTDTQDKYGIITAEGDASNITTEQIKTSFAKFEGKILQIPPMVSAVKYQGKRLYQLARAGIEVERAPREITIYSLEILDIYDLATKHPKVKFEVICSKGTYVRTLCADIGADLGTGGFMSELIRTKSGPFKLQEAHSLEQIQAMSEQSRVCELITSLDQILGHLPALVVRDSALLRVKNGNQLYEAGIVEPPPDSIHAGDTVRLSSTNGELLAIAKAKENPEKPTQLLFQPETVF